jgi:hypothetical protein
MSYAGKLFRISFLMIGLIFTYAFSNPPSSVSNKPVIQDAELNSINAFWISDTVFEVFVQNPMSSEIHVYEYDVKTEQLAEPTIKPQAYNVASFLLSPFYIALSPQQVTTFEARDLNAYLSPDKQKIIYTTASRPCDEMGNCFDQLAIAELQSGKHYLLGTGGNYAHDSGYELRWSQDSSAFTTSIYPNYGDGKDIYLVTGLRNDPPQLNSLWLTTVYNAQRPFLDMSSDGMSLLLSADMLGYTNSLVLWHSGTKATHNRLQKFLKDNPGFAMSDGELLFEKEIVGAAFYSRNKNEVLIVNRDGVLRYNVLTQRGEIVNPNINSKWAKEVIFSPNQDYAAVFSNSQGNQYYNADEIQILPVGP